MPKEVKISEEGGKETFPAGLYLYSGKEKTLTFMAKSTTPNLPVVSEEERIKWAKKNDPEAVPETVKAKDWNRICTLMATDDQIRSLANAPGQIKLVKIKIIEKLSFPLIYMEYLFAMNQPTFTEES